MKKKNDNELMMKMSSKDAPVNMAMVQNRGDIGEEVSDSLAN